MGQGGSDFGLRQTAATFTIDTPFGPYNPDWAYVREEGDGTKRLYLVVETKGGQKGQTNTRGPERAKIDCATMHFKQITAEYPDFEYKPQSQFK
ncbi:restriction endonuclease [Bifidobacterium pseudolongum]|uniref:restriction endonuclease n=1 Tax=Bifidobacterium pseudolongum TaxID=1694 RepID=UPI0035A26C14